MIRTLSLASSLYSLCFISPHSIYPIFYCIILSLPPSLPLSLSPPLPPLPPSLSPSLPLSLSSSLRIFFICSYLSPSLLVFPHSSSSIPVCPNTSPSLPIYLLVSPIPPSCPTFLCPPGPLSHDPLSPFLPLSLPFNPTHIS